MASVRSSVSLNNRNRILISHFKEMISTRDTHVDCILSDKDTFEFIFRIRNLKGVNNELENGEYLLKLIPPNNYPMKPPSFEFLTPNGIYALGGPICISTGAFHSQNYRATGKMIGFARDAWTAMIQWEDLGRGLKIIAKPNTKYIRNYAQESKKYNRKFYASYITKLDELPMNKMYDFMESNKIRNNRLKCLIYKYMNI